MRQLCGTTQEQLGWGGTLDPEQAEHIAKCSDCGELASELARVDALLTSEPILPAPPVVLSEVLQRVASQRRHETRWVRAQMLLVAAAAMLIGALGLSLASPILGQIEQHGAALAEESEVSIGVLTVAQEFAFDLGSSLESSLASTLSTAPNPSWMVLLATLVALLMANWSIARVRPVVA